MLSTTELGKGYVGNASVGTVFSGVGENGWVLSTMELGKGNVGNASVGKVCSGVRENG